MKDNSIDIAVIMCVYSGDTLDRLRIACNSILNQSKDSYFLIYVDGYVSYDIGSYLEDLSNRRLVLLYKSSTNRGLAFGLNFLIDKCSSLDVSYIARMDADDISYSSRLEKQYDCLEYNNNVDVLGTFCLEFGSKMCKEKSVPLSHDSLVNYSYYKSPFIHPTVMFRSDIFFVDNFRYPCNTTLSEDISLWHELLLHNKVFMNLSEVLLDFYLPVDTLSRRRGLNKACSEFICRIDFWIKMKSFNPKYIFLIFLRFFFNLLPPFLLFYLYRYFR